LKPVASRRVEGRRHHLRLENRDGAFTTYVVRSLDFVSEHSISRLARSTYLSKI
jgi:hypothetical protein